MHTQRYKLIVMLSLSLFLWESLLLYIVIMFYLGYGVYVNRDVTHGEFLLEYCGQFISEQEADARESTYLYWFEVGGNSYM